LRWKRGFLQLFSFWLERRAKIERVRCWIGCARAELEERGGSTEFGEPRNPYSLLSFNQEFRLGEMKSHSFCTIVICIKFWWVYAMIFELCMIEIRGLGAVTIALQIFQLSVWMWVFFILYRWFVVQLGFWEPKIVLKLCLYDCA